ncbi:hypothetical protein CEXT_539301 [Caerostris extrusa]|uniref:Uncharacterized protein n=1 Tax=Caerostris extrusa TaxID=172846 RepID=A0AAV4TNM7_CAEEX|nr:hypothetical protein CEXT_539301 [Caerostris extrusa]
MVAMNSLFYPIIEAVSPNPRRIFAECSHCPLQTTVTSLYINPMKKTTSRCSRDEAAIETLPSVAYFNQEIEHYFLSQ